MAFILAIILMLAGITVTGQKSATTLADPTVIKRYFENALIYPEHALQQGIKGKIIVAFEVMPDGTTTNFLVQRGIDSLMDAEALRLAQHILWKPAILAGNPVASRETITIEFNPKAYQRKKRVGMRIDQGIPSAGGGSDLIYQLRQLNEPPQLLLPEGFRSVNTYLMHLMKYPEMAVRNNISGTVVLDFVIETNGLASNIRIRESVGGGCDQEAIRILEQLRWTPGRKAEVSVRTHADIEIAFQLNKHQQGTIPNQRNTGL